MFSFFIPNLGLNKMQPFIEMSGRFQAVTRLFDFIGPIYYKLYLFK